MFENYKFQNPEFFWVFLILPVCVFWYLWTINRQQAELKISNLQGFKIYKSWLAQLKPFLFIFRLLACAMIIVAMARPRTVDVSTKIKTTKGIDIIIAIDISASMLAKDLRPNRLEATKKVASEFIKGRPNDRIGLVLYAGESFTKTPLTSDKAIVLNAMKQVKYDTRLVNGTAIGMGLATAVNRLKDSKAKSKVIILLTDGSNNAGFIDPKIASELAVEYGIKTYTIGLGTNGNALAPVAMYPNGKFRYDYVEVEIDEKLLKEIAKVTDGKYFRATNNKKLEQIYSEINKLEKTDIEEFKFYNYEEKFRPFVILALLLIFTEFLLRQTLFKSFL